MMNSKERLEGVKNQAIKEIVIKARENLIRRNFFKLIFKSTTK
jgi:hypothetical protein